MYSQGYSNNNYPNSQVRTKSVDKIQNNPFSNNNPNSISNSSNNSNNNTLKGPQKFIYNVLPQKQQNEQKPNVKFFHLKQPQQYHYEGDLNNFDKITPYQANIRTIPKNYNKNQLDALKGVALNNNILSHLNKEGHVSIKRHHRKNIPRKSPIPITRSYLVQNNNIYSQLPGFPGNNYMYNNYQNQPSNVYGGNNNPNSTKIKSSIIKMKGDSPYLAPGNKQRIVNKSPNINVAALFDKFKKYKIVDYSHNNSGNYNEHLHNSGQVIFNHKLNQLNNRPKSSNAYEKIFLADKEQKEHHHYSNSFTPDKYGVSERVERKDKERTDLKLKTHNLNIIKPNKEPQHDIAISNNSNHPLNNSNLTDSKQQHSQNSQRSSYKSKTEKTDSMSVNGTNVNRETTSNKETVNSHSNNTRINIDAAPSTTSLGNTNTNISNNTTQKMRSNSQATPERLQEFINSSHMKNTSNANIDNVPIEKKIRNIYQFTHVGFDGEADKAHNQDIAFIEQNFTGNPKYFYMSVCDGHGIDGHGVSGFIKKILPKKMTRLLKGKDLENPTIEEQNEIYKLITKGFRGSNNDLIRNVNVNSTFSGSTCVSVIFTPSKLISANIGDSRAVIGRYEQATGKWTSHNLTRDHKPTEKDEAQRIYNSSGRIQSFIDEETGEFVGPKRVWLKEDNVPGLAMTRSFGDRVAATVGVMSDPEILEYELSERDKFVLIASDGVWEFISSSEVVNIIKDFYIKNDMKGCCEYLYSESKKRWLHEEEVVDDITMVLVFYDK